jgi:hypothetical protein
MSCPWHQGAPFPFPVSQPGVPSRTLVHLSTRSTSLLSLSQTYAPKCHLVLREGVQRGCPT